MSERGGGLDALFSAREEPVVEEVEQPPRQRSRVLPLIRDAALIIGASVVTIAAMRAGNLDAPIVLVVGSFLALRLIIWAVSEVAAPPRPKRSADQGGPDTGSGVDALRAAVRRWELNLDRAHADPDLYSRNVLPVLAELADERLRLRHGITRESDPRRARELLGDPLWAALHDRGRRAAKARELETYVDALERL